jgi:hypothetical protein
MTAGPKKIAFASFNPVSGVRMWELPNVSAMNNNEVLIVMFYNN